MVHCVNYMQQSRLTDLSTKSAIWFLPLICLRLQRFQL